MHFVLVLGITNLENEMEAEFAVKLIKNHSLYNNYLSPFVNDYRSNPC